MPIYTFKCSSCEYVEDKLIPMDDANKTFTCKECGADAMIRTFDQSGTNFILKGKGWFKNDGKY